MKSADANDDGRVNVADSIAILNYLFSAGVPPPVPFSGCGRDTTQDPLGCESYPPCDV